MGLEPNVIQKSSIFQSKVGIHGTLLSKDLTIVTVFNMDSRIVIEYSSLFLFLIKTLFFFPLQPTPLHLEVQVVAMACPIRRVVVLRDPAAVHIPRTRYRPTTTCHRTP